MLDYVARVEAMTAEQVIKEIDRYVDKLYGMNPHSSMYQQMYGNLELLRQRQAEISMIEQFQQQPQDQIIELGTVQEYIQEPHDQDELLRLTAQQYIDHTKNQEQ